MNVPTQDGRSRGYGIVSFQSAADAKKAMEKFNEFEWMGRVLAVRPDNRRTPSGASGERAPGSRNREYGENRAPASRSREYGETRAPRSREFNNGTSSMVPRHQAFVANLAWTVSWQDLKDVAKEHGLSPFRAHVAMG